MIRFGTDGIRGKGGSPPITAEVGVAVGRAAVRLARRTGGSRVMIARDTRPSGPMLASAVAAGVAAEGGEALLAEVLPTAGLMANLACGAADAGVMVTASHNAAPDNGFKVLGEGGRKLSDADARRFEAWLDEAPEPGTPGTVRAVSLQARRAYHRRLDEVAPASSALQAVRLAVDLAHGAATPTERWLQERYPGVTWEFLGVGEGVINDGVGSEHPEALARRVRETGCAAGFAVDGDADRCRLVDETGRVVPGDALAWLLADRLAVRSLAVTVMSTSALEAALPGVHVERTRVGDRHLARAMAQQGIPVGCEESGHVLFQDGLPGGDGVLTGLRAVALARLDEAPLSEALAPFTPFPRRTTKVPVTERPALDEVAPLQEAVRTGEARLGAGGRVFLRYSGTEPVLRILVEGPEDEVVDAVSADVTQRAREVMP